jgi:hypothetical protein
MCVSFSHFISYFWHCLALFKAFFGGALLGDLCTTFISSKFDTSSVCLGWICWCSLLFPGSFLFGQVLWELGEPLRFCSSRDNTSVKSYLPGFLAQAGCFPVAILLIFSRVGPIHLVLGVERPGWWGGVKATIQLPPLPLLEVIVSAIAPLAN